MASTDMQRLIVSLEARTKAFENALNRANGVANRRAKAIESRFAAMNRNVTANFTGLSRGMVAAFAGAAGLRAATGFIDTSVRITNALKVAGLEGEALEATYQRLMKSAKDNAAPLESLVQLYSRVVLVQKELGVSGEQVEGLVNTIAVALRVAGVDAQSASGALLQLSQALGSGVVRAEEFNSILEGAPTILQAAAAGIREAEGSVSKLRQIMLDGELSSRALFDGIEAGSVMLEDKLAGAQLTVSQAFENLRTSLVNAAKELNEGSEASDKMAAALEWLAQAIANTDFSPAISGVMEFVGHLGNAIDMIGQYARAAGDLTGASSLGPWLQGKLRERQQQSAIDNRINGAFGSIPTASEASAMEPTQLEPISIRDEPYRVTSSSGKRGGGSSTGRGSRENPFERETRQIRERTVALQAETAAMAGLNPLVDDYGFALEKASATQELLNAAERAGLAITPELRASIDALATGYANASVEAEKLAESQDQIRQTADDMRALGKDVLSGFISDLRQGTSAAEALQNALGKIADKLLDLALTSLFDPKGGGGIGGLFKLLGFADGGYTGPGGKNDPAGVVHKGEVVFSQDDVRRAGGVGAVEAMRKGMAAGPAINVPKIAPSASSGRQAVHVTVGVDVDSSGNLMPFVASVSEQTTKAGIRQYDRGSEGRLRRDSKLAPRRGRV